jgi:hypothetical protein
VIGPVPMCVNCKRYDRETATCSAYPDGILQEILMNQWDHRLRGPAPPDRTPQWTDLVWLAIADRTSCRRFRGRRQRLAWAESTHAAVAFTQR